MPVYMWLDSFAQGFCRVPIYFGPCLFHSRPTSGLSQNNQTWNKRPVAPDKWFWVATDALNIAVVLVLLCVFYQNNFQCWRSCGIGRGQISEGPFQVVVASLFFCLQKHLRSKLVLDPTSSTSNAKVSKWSIW